MPSMAMVGGSRLYSSDDPFRFMKRRLDQHPMMPGWSLQEWIVGAHIALDELVAQKQLPTLWHGVLAQPEYEYKLVIELMRKSTSSMDAADRASAELVLKHTITTYNEAWRVLGMHGASPVPEPITDPAACAHALLANIEESFRLYRDYTQNPSKYSGITQTGR